MPGTVVPPSTELLRIPVLGRQWGRGQNGYGQAKPPTIFNGGDPTGLVDNITWVTWGSDRATGTGLGYFPRRTVADSTRERATVVAFNLGTCGGVPMYQAVEWFFPQEGGSFDPNTYINICTGEYVNRK